jgi:ribosome production factor 1
MDVWRRHHRYVFEEKSKKVKKEEAKKVVQARLQELGPRFTLKLEAVQKGTFDTQQGEFEWVHKKDMDTSRRRFFL